MISEHRPAAAQLVLPLFVSEDATQPEAVEAMPGVFRHTLGSLADVAEQAWQLGLRSLILFGIPRLKDAVGSQADDEIGIVQRGIAVIKERVPEMVVMTDVCLCEYTDHGHCGLIHPVGDSAVVHNDQTLERLAEIALSHARAGADIVAPSAMMDGQVAIIRKALDHHGFSDIGIMAYSAKFASAYYGPFREAAGSVPHFGDRRAYQMDPANRREALREVALDVEEGADIVMVKPSLAYLDIIREVRPKVTTPIAAYNVSGEYSMVKAAAEKGWLDERTVVLENLTAFVRAGADLIISYHALDAAAWLREA